ncbi:Sec-independent protein translocase protein TatB [Pseudomonas sp. LRF_L74]|uniref:Sec-independent protein translocase protein TatB n=1 Tax=Pseudomonas sp. LRF_L74 TaxID=3369422 RepID=UPI003F5DE9F4
MFGIGFSELLLVGLVALIVFGPEKLPGAARTAGLWIGRLKRSFNAIKMEVERELGADEIRRQLHNERILEMERELRQSLQAPTSASTTPEAPIASPVAEPLAQERPNQPDAALEPTAPKQSSPQPPVQELPQQPTQEPPRQP